MMNRIKKQVIVNKLNVNNGEFIITKTNYSPVQHPIQFFQVALMVQQTYSVGRLPRPEPAAEKCSCHIKPLCSLT